MVGKGSRFGLVAVACIVALAGGCELLMSPMDDVFIVPLSASSLFGAWIDPDDDYNTGTGFAAHMDGDTFQAVRFDWTTGEIVGAAVGFGGPTYRSNVYFDLNLSSYATLNTTTGLWEERGPTDTPNLSVTMSEGQMAYLAFNVYDSTPLGSIFKYAHAERVSTSIPSLRNAATGAVGVAQSLEPSYVQGGDDIVDLVWAVVTAPEGSSASVEPIATGYSFTPDAAGTFLLRFLGRAENYRTPPGFLTIEVGP